jgi:hypothetical protein
MSFFAICEIQKLLIVLLAIVHPPSKRDLCPSRRISKLCLRVS